MRLDSGVRRELPASRGYGRRSARGPCRKLFAWSAACPMRTHSMTYWAVTGFSPKKGRMTVRSRSVITEAAQVGRGHRAVIAQQCQDLIPGQCGVLRRLPCVAFIGRADRGRDLLPRDNRLDESFEDAAVRAADMGANSRGRPSLTRAGHTQIGGARNHIDHILVDLFEPGGQLFRACAHIPRFLPRANGVMSPFQNACTIRTQPPGVNSWGLRRYRDRACCHPGTGSGFDRHCRRLWRCASACPMRTRSMNCSAVVGSSPITGMGLLRSRSSSLNPRTYSVARAP